jgi:terminase, large subunit
MSYISSFKSGLMPDPDTDLIEWAENYFYLPRESSKEYGKYNIDRTPMVREILAELSPSSPTQEIVVQKPTQLAGSTAAIIFLIGTADISPGPSLCIQPTETLAKAFSRKKIDPTIKAIIKNAGRLVGKIKDQKSRDSTNTILEKIFPGGSWRFAGSNSPAVYRSESVRYIVLDDFDGFDVDVGGEGDPGELADRRTGTFSNRKIYKNSTPTTKGTSNIENAYNLSSQGKFEVPCPRCGEYQYLEFGGEDTKHGIKFERNDNVEITDYYYICRHCKGRIDEHEKEHMLKMGKYVHKYPNRKIRGFKYNALYTPVGWVNTWKKIIEVFLASKDNPEKLKTWMNTLMAETFEEKGARPKWEVLSSRAEPYKIITVPPGGMVLTMGTDVHDNRLDIVVRAWGRGEENWLIYWTRIYGNINTTEPWDRHDDVLAMAFRHASGLDLRIVSSAIDSGDNTQTVYNYCRTRKPIVMATYGSQKRGQPVLGKPAKKDIDYKGHRIKNGIEIWPVGTDTVKSLVYQRFNIEEPGPGYYHFPLGLDDEYYMQITAEKLVTTYNKKGFRSQDWVVIRGNRQNHALDAEVYCYAAAVRAGVPRMNWDELERNFQYKIDQNADNSIQELAKMPQKQSTYLPIQSGWLR